MASIVGLLHLEFRVSGATSLKDKRRATKSFKDRLSNAHNVSVAEVDGLDNHRRVVLAVAMVGNDSQYIEAALQKVINLAGSDRDMTLVRHEIEWA